MRKRWPTIKLTEAQATTESPIAAISDYDNPEFGNARHPTCYANLKILDPGSGQKQITGKVGEIVYGHQLGSDYLLREYHKDPGRRAETMIGREAVSKWLGLINDETMNVRLVRTFTLRANGDNEREVRVDAVKLESEYLLICSEAPGADAPGLKSPQPACIEALATVDSGQARSRTSPKPADS